MSTQPSQFFKVRAIAVVIAIGLALPSAVRQTKAVADDDKATTTYKSAQEAANVGAAYYTTKSYKASRDAFEAAIALAEDDGFKIRIYRSLMAVYRHLPENDKMFDAVDFIVTNSGQDAERSLTRRSLLSFAYERGLVEKAIERYEQILKKEPKHRTALYILSEVYVRLQEDPKRSAELIERLAEVEKEAGKEPGGNVATSAKLAGEYVKARKFAQGAELYEKIAPLDTTLAAWHWKEAAGAWLQAKDKDRALTAAKKADESPPEKRNDLLIHFWHAGLADIFLQLDEPKSAIPHFEKAIEHTNIDGYKKSCEKKLEEARTKANALN